MRALLAARKDLRIALASVLYRDGKISLGKSVEIADVGYEELKKILVEKGIRLRRATSSKEMNARLARLAK
ncbi:UPF0175 family protein [Candidatus Woesearchaeota archaeon]|nr:UPF0175 family protein [Candidatus Woesearchaeota archaeon]